MIQAREPLSNGHKADRVSNVNPLDGRRGDRVLVAANVLVGRVAVSLGRATALRLLLPSLVGGTVQLANEVPLSASDVT
ncbi:MULTISPECIES: hypothetical protein [unclassified Bradyrhizobium]|uniref:hypothetical protein n=1 Tax=unclassified Bradyrhizobium TaxID=2631580 RepID=UPI001FFBA224|nr:MULTISPECIES: hypothetical protein [unclassified Bradyrhizobium]MCK1309874.1 hypothetical protein [Bradyrhizobium sp. 45]MCK1317362.1 hypothetical protein [Bradyrhizobium sp. 23]MCK1435377.1 hypothetical protein [Bradyrhizobium sp. 15]MCK1614920.1 hypothetical protein [Bradyrhizobium sp. 163]MCK1760230.1 hypothetical protein [Bradyrhizobium sp. 136]